MSVYKIILVAGLLGVGSSAVASTSINCEGEACGNQVLAMNDYDASNGKRGAFPSSREGTGKRVFIFSPAKLKWAAYDEDGQLVRTGAASGGKRWCADAQKRCQTPAGSYAVYRKGGAGCKSSKYPLGKGGAPMKYCMFFKGGYAIHASNHVPAYNASHGCVRVQLKDAKWLSQNFMKKGTSVVVMPYKSQRS